MSASMSIKYFWKYIPVIGKSGCLLGEDSRSNFRGKLTFKCILFYSMNFKNTY